MTPLPINPTPQDYLDRIHEAFGMMLTAENIIKNCLDNYVHVTRHAAQEPDEKEKDLFGWHLGSEFPEGCKGMDDPHDRIYLIEPKGGGLSYISRWWGENHWKTHVNQWQYILPPKRIPS